MRAYRAYPGVDADGNLRAWLFRIAANVHHNHVRSRSRRSKAAWTLADGTQRNLHGSEAAQDGAGPALAYQESA